MASNDQLTPVTFLNNVTVTSTSNWYNVNYKYSTNQTRTINGKRSSGNDVIMLEYAIIDPNGASVTATATVWAISGNPTIDATTLGPYSRVRVVKKSGSGTVTVVGLI